MQLFIGADHNGFEMKTQLIEGLQSAGYQIKDEGDRQVQPLDDFPQFAERVVRAMQASNDPDTKGILICGSGQGMCIAANRFKGIRASLVWDEAEARSARNDDDSNVICLPARFMDDKRALAIVNTWLATPFAGAARFRRRIRQLDELGG